MNVAVIGAGAAGMLFAIEASRAGHSVTVFEKNEKCGKKLYITGKGRCNLTNLSDNATILQNVVTNPKFLFAAIAGFSSEDTYRYFEELGVPLKTERGNRVFPDSDKSSDVIAGLKIGMEKARVKLFLNTTVDAVLTENDAVVGVSVKGKSICFDAVAIATGGKTYPATGSTGDGYRFAESLGHTVTPLSPALTEMTYQTAEGSDGIVMQREELPPLEGLSLKNVSLSAFSAKKQLAVEFGEMIFTEKGISGPIALTLSSFVCKTNLSTVTLSLDLKPALAEEQLDARILRELDGNKNKFYKNVLTTLLPSKMIPYFIALSGVPEEKEVRSITKEERKAIVQTLKNMTFSKIRTGGFSSAVITSGGVSVKEINPKTMESKLVKKLFFIGEVLDIDALTGGFNLQIAFSTAIAAARHLSECELDTKEKGAERK